MLLYNMRRTLESAAVPAPPRYFAASTDTRLRRGAPSSSASSAARYEALQVADERLLRGASSSSTSTTSVKGKCKTAKRDASRFDIFADHTSTCDKFNGECFCTSRKCRNNIHVSRPHGSTMIGHVGTDEGSPGNTMTSTRSKTSPQPKPSDQQSGQEFVELMSMFTEHMNDVRPRSDTRGRSSSPARTQTIE